MSVGERAVDWFAETTNGRAHRCVAFLLLVGVINAKDAETLATRVGGRLHAVERGEQPDIPLGKVRA